MKINSILSRFAVNAIPKVLSLNSCFFLVSISTKNLTFKENESHAKLINSRLFTKSNVMQVFAFV